MKKENNLEEKEPYITPNIEVVELEMEQNILAGSGTGIPGMPGEPY